MEGGSGEGWDDVVEMEEGLGVRCEREIRHVMRGSRGKGGVAGLGDWVRRDESCDWGMEIRGNGEWERN